MTKAEIKLNNGTIVKIDGSVEEIERILNLYPKLVTSISQQDINNTQSENSNFIIKSKKALDWAKKQTGTHVQPCNTPKCKYNYNDKGLDCCKIPNPCADDDDVKKENHDKYHPFWNFYCMRFVRSAYKAPANYPKAYDLYKHLSKAEKIKTDSNIPKGVLVFWYWSDYGHIGIYTGDNMVVHTGVNPSKKTVGIRENLLEEITEVLNGYNHYDINGSRTSYLGWAYPPKEWL